MVQPNICPSEPSSHINLKRGLASAEPYTPSSHKHLRLGSALQIIRIWWHPHSMSRNYSTDSLTFSNAKWASHIMQRLDQAISHCKTWEIRRSNIRSPFEIIYYSAESPTFSNAKWPTQIMALEITPPKAMFSLGSIGEYAE